MLHSFLDYELAFASVYMLLIFGIMYEPSYYANFQVRLGVLEIKPVIIRTVSACVVILCIIGMVGVIKTRNLQNAADSGDLSKAVAIFEDNRILMEKGYKECEIIGVEACKTGNYEYVPETKSARLRMYEVISKESRMDEITDLLNSQPYNRRVIANTREMLTQYSYSDEDKERYRECLSKINESLDKWPANMLNNQVKYHVAEE